VFNLETAKFCPRTLSQPNLWAEIEMVKAGMDGVYRYTFQGVNLGRFMKKNIGILVVY